MSNQEPEINNNNPEIYGSEEPEQEFVEEYISEEPEQDLEEVEEAVEEEQTEEAVAEQVPEAEPADNKPQKNSFKKRIDRQNNKIKQLEEEKRKLEELLDKTYKPIEFPDANEYSDEGAYLEAYLEAKTNKALQDREIKKYEHIQEQHQTALTEKLVEIMLVATEEHPELKNILETTDLPASPTMMETILESDKAPEMFHYLALHPEECERISQLSPRKAAVEMDKLETKLKTKQVTKAPVPTKTKKPGQTLKITRNKDGVEFY